jgi:energy-coupling factor transporter ATP-binding protein EcfA2
MMPSRRAFRQQLSARLLRGERLVIWGPRGIGKSTLLAQLHRQFSDAGVRCGCSPETAHLEDITRALARAYPEVQSEAMQRRAARSRLWVAADREGSVLLLDHVTAVNNTMVGFLRRLVGGIAGVLLAVDVVCERERRLLRPERLGALPLAMPAMSAREMRRLWCRQCEPRRIPRLGAQAERCLLRTAAGRPGWIAHCAGLAAQSRYRREGELTLSTCCAPIQELALRFGSESDDDFNQPGSSETVPYADELLRGHLQRMKSSPARRR